MSQMPDSSPAAPLTAEMLAQSARARSTQRSYASCWRSFERWCAAEGVPALPAPPETVGRYLAAQGGRLTVGTLECHLSAILVRHRHEGFHHLDRHHPAIADILAGLGRLVGRRARPKEPIIAPELKRIVAHLPPTLAGRRDKAILLLGYAGAFRRGELAAIQLHHLCWSGDGVIVSLPRSKEDQGGRGAVKAIPFATDPAYCPVRALQELILTMGVDQGPVFRRIDRHGNLARRAPGLSGAAICAVVKRAVWHWARANGATRAEADAQGAQIGGHSLRAGLVSWAVAQGMSDWAVMAVSLHRSRRSLAPYVRRVGLFTGSAAGAGL